MMKEKLDFNIISISKIQKSENIRDDSTEIDDLKESIKVHGLLQPVVVSVSGKNYKMVAGHRRLRACKLLNWTEIPAVIKTFKNDKIIQLTENMQRKNMNRIEESECIYDLQNTMKVTTGRLAAIIGKDPSWTAKRISFIQIREHLIKAGIIPIKLINSISFDIVWIVGKHEKKYWIQMCSNLIGKRWYPEQIREYCKSVADPDYISPKRKYQKVKNKSITDFDTAFSTEYADEFSIIKDDHECMIKLLCATEKSYKYLLIALEKAGGVIL